MMRRCSVAFKICIAANLCAILSNLELLYLSNHDISALFCSVLFNVNMFMEEKQFFLVINVLFALSLSCYLFSKDIVDYYTIYTFSRIKSKIFFFLKRMVVIVGKQLIFSTIYCFTIMMLCGISCNEGLDGECVWILVKSIVAITYSGAFFGIICSAIALFCDDRNAVLSIMIIMLIVTFASMTFSDFLSGSRLLLVINPITTVTLVGTKFSASLIFDCLLALLVLLVEMFVVANICKRKELH